MAREAGCRLRQIQPARVYQSALVYESQLSLIRRKAIMAPSAKPTFFKSLRFRYGLALAVFLAAALYLLWDEHQAHILGYGPLLLILLVCGGMHFFHHGHGGGGNSAASQRHKDPDGGDQS